MHWILDKLREKHEGKKWFIFIEQLVYRYQEDSVSEIGAQLAYYLILAIFPFIIFFLSILQFTPLAETDILHQLLSPLPGDSKELFYGILDDIIKGGSIGLLSFGAIGSIWASSNGMMALIKAVNKAFDLKENRTFIKLRVLSLLFTIGLLLVLLVAFGLLIFGEVIFNAIDVSYTSATAPLWELLRFLIPLIFTILSFNALYKFSPSIRKGIKIRLSESIPGAIFTGIIWTLLTIGFSFYVNNFGGYSNTYGSLGGVIVFLIWLYMSSIVIVLGAEVNAILLSMKDMEDKGFSSLNQNI